MIDPFLLLPCSTLHFYAIDLVEAKTRAGGEIIIYGKPKQINELTQIKANKNFLLIRNTNLMISQ